jgi:hypothetical protein
MNSGRRFVLGGASLFAIACGVPIADPGFADAGGGQAGSAGAGHGGAGGQSAGGADAKVGAGGTTGGMAGAGGTSAGSSGTSGSGGATAGKAGAGGQSDAGDGGPTFVNDSGVVAPRPPIIATTAPLAGDYGTEVTITGDDFNSAGATLVLSSPKGTPVSFAMPTAPSNDPNGVIRVWSKTEIRFKYPFPAEGAIVVRTNAGQATAGSFLPSWSPGQPISGTFSKAGLLDVTSPAAGRIVAAFDRDTGPTLLVADGTSVTPVAFERGAATLNQMNLVSTPGGSVAGYFAIGTPPTVRRMTLSQGIATTADTAVALTADAPFFAAGIDTAGEYLWARRTAGQLVRLRAPSWTPEGVPVTEPSNHKSLSGATSPDGSLYVVWGWNVSSTFDDYAYPIAGRLRPAQVTFAAAVRAGPLADDYMLWTRSRAADSGEVVSYYCATDTGLGSASTDCDEGYLDATGTYQSGAPIAVGFGAAGSVMAKCDSTTATLKFGPTADTVKQVGVLYPCPTPLAAVVDSAGTGLLLVKSGTDVYSPRKR